MYQLFVLFFIARLRALNILTYGTNFLEGELVYFSKLGYRSNQPIYLPVFLPPLLPFFIGNIY